MPRGRPAKGRASSKAQPAVKANHDAEVKPQEKRTHKKMKLADVDDDDDEDDGALNVIMQEVKERTRRHKSHHELSETAWKSEQKVASQQRISDQKKEEEEVLKSFKQEPEEKEHSKILINRAPVLTLWVAVVAEREGYTFEEGLSFGRFIAALFARTKGQRLGIFEKEVEAEARKAQKLVAPKGKRRVEQVERFEVFGMRIPGIRTETGLRLAVWGGKPIHPNVVKAYLLRAFGSDFDHVKAAMEELARAIPPDRIGKEAYHLYEKFRPQVPEGPQGWGAKGILDLDLIWKLAQEHAKS